MSGIVYNGNTGYSFKINGVTPDVYYNGNKIWPAQTVPATYSFVISGSNNSIGFSLYDLTVNGTYPATACTWTSKNGTTGQLAANRLKYLSGTDMNAQQPEYAYWSKLNCDFGEIANPTSISFSNNHGTYENSNRFSFYFVRTINNVNTSALLSADVAPTAFIGRQTTFNISF